MIIPPEMHRLFLLFGCEGAGGLETLADYLAQAKAPQRRVRMAEVLEWAERTFSGLELRVAWNQPVFTDHGTFIVGISVSAGHLAVSPGRAWRAFSGNRPGRLCRGKMLFRIPWERDVDYTLLRRMIAFNRTEKAHCKTFWRGKA